MPLVKALHIYKITGSLNYAQTVEQICNESTADLSTSSKINSCLEEHLLFPKLFSYRFLPVPS